MAAMKSMPHLKPMLYANNKVLVKNFNDCYEQVLAELGKTQESCQSSQEGMYTKKDYDNMILKKERLILEKNAELFPEGKCKIALELFDKYESIKAAKREPTVSFRKDIPIKPKQFAKAEKQQCSVKKGSQIVKQKQNLGYLSDKNLFRHKGTNKVANIETLMESISSLYANFQDQDIEDGEGSIFDEKAQDLEAQPIKNMGKQGRAKDSSKLKKAASKQKKIKCILTNSVLLKSNVNKEQCGQKNLRCE
ncbi:unnamed protein product [Moneuplotes crassus]|uniref:Uncharacterized protein n=1 Tax=Euplotes crassus TaxID=5936 RepID=A0AAD1UGE0_EUPCR|nr:unnamed protein product [Moneuplotes crassus]